MLAGLQRCRAAGSLPHFRSRGDAGRARGQAQGVGHRGRGLRAVGGLRSEGRHHRQSAGPALKSEAGGTLRVVGAPRGTPDRTAEGAVHSGIRCRPGDGTSAGSATRGNPCRTGAAATGTGKRAPNDHRGILYRSGGDRGRRRPGESPRGGQTNRLADRHAYPGYQNTPAFSPDGQTIAFSWGGPEGGAPRIYVQRLDADVPRRLTNSASRDRRPAWLPDGEHVGFLRDDGRTGSHSWWCRWWARASSASQRSLRIPLRRRGSSGRATARNCTPANASPNTLGIGEHSWYRMLLELSRKSNSCAAFGRTASSRTTT